MGDGKAKGSSFKARDTATLAVAELRSMGATGDGVARNIVEGLPVRHRLHPGSPFVVDVVSEHGTFSRGRCVARGKGAPVSVVELRNLIE